MKTLAIAVVALCAALPAPAHAWPGQRLFAQAKQNRADYRAQRLLDKQHDFLIKQNPELKVVRRLKMLEYKAGNPLGIAASLGVGSGVMLVGMSPGRLLENVGTIVATTATTTLLSMLSRHGGARDYARTETVKYAAERGIPLAPPGITLGVPAK